MISRYSNFKNNYKSTVRLCLVALLFFMIYVTITGYKENLESFMVVMQLVVGCSFIFLLYITPSFKNLNQLIFCIFGYNLLFSVTFRLIFIDYYNTVYGLAVDSYAYDQISIKSISKTFHQVIVYLSTIWDIDDWGYSLYTIFWFKIFGYELGRWMVLISNSVLITASSYLLYHISYRLYNINHIAIATSAMWGFFPFLFITTSVGLKENVFCFIIIAFWFFSYNYFLNKKRIFSLLWAIAFASLTFMFRKAICLMLIISLLLMVIMNKKNNNTLKWLIILGGIITPIVGAYIIETFTGSTMEQISAVTEARNSSMDSSVSGSMVQALAAILGPFPNFNRLVDYGLYHSVGLLFKSIMSGFTISGLYKIITHNKYVFYPVVLYFLFGLSMLIIGGVALDMRYAVTFYMAFIIICCYGFLECRRNFFIYTIQFTSLAVILFYNNR